MRPFEAVASIPARLTGPATVYAEPPSPPLSWHAGKDPAPADPDEPEMSDADGKAEAEALIQPDRRGGRRDEDHAHGKLLPIGAYVGTLLGCLGPLVALMLDGSIGAMVAGPQVFLGLTQVLMIDQHRSRRDRGLYAALLVLVYVVAGVALGFSATDLARQVVLGLVLSLIVYVPYLRRTGGRWFPRSPWDVLQLVALSAVGIVVILPAVLWPAWDYPVGAVWPSPLLWAIGQFVRTVFTLFVVLALATPPRPTYATLRHRRALPLYLVACLACLTVPYLLPAYRLDWLILLPALCLGVTLTPRLAGIGILVFAAAHVSQAHSPLTVTSGSWLPAGYVTQFILTFAATLTFMLVASREHMAELDAHLQRAATDDSLDAEFLTSVVHTMTDGILLTNEDGYVIMSNAAARGMLGRAASTDDHGGWLTAYGVRARDGANLDGPDLERLLRPQADETSTLTVSIPGTEGNDDRFYAVTARHLPQEGYNLIVISDTTTEHTRHRELESFAGTVAHDLRTPLTSLALWMELAEGDLGVDLDSALDALVHAHESSLRMRDLIDDYLAYTVTREGMLSPEPVDLAEVVRDVVGLFGEGSEAPTIEVELAATVVQADRALMTQLVTNLVSNSVKYARPGIPAHVVVRAVADPDPDWLRVQVEDRGQGLDEDDLVRIFRPFARSSRGTQGSQGIGLGLALCHAIVTRHRGQIRASNNAWGGATIEFSLPRATAMAL